MSIISLYNPHMGGTESLLAILYVIFLLAEETHGETLRDIHTVPTKLTFKASSAQLCSHHHCPRSQL